MTTTKMEIINFHHRSLKVNDLLSTFLGYVALSILAFPVLFIGENLASISVWFQSQLKFDIVQKEKDGYVTSKDNQGTSIDSHLVHVI